jgi:tRNA-specific adenosine deaminase 1
MKCLSKEKVPLAKGNVLHDCHAEVLAIRAFNRWLVEECKSLVLDPSRTDEEEEEKQGVNSGERRSPWVRWRRRRLQQDDDVDREDDADSRLLQPPFELHDDVRIHMYCSEAPCGDASMEVLARGMADGGTPWEMDDPSTVKKHDDDEGDQMEKHPSASDSSSFTTNANLLHGRAFFSLVGIVRRKPGRADAPPTLSKSCSDKLAMKQCTGLLSALTALLVAPTANTYLSSFVLPARAVVDESVERAFGPEGRMESVVAAALVGESRGEAAFRFRPFRVRTTNRRFAWEKSEDCVASNLSAVVVAAATGREKSHQEVLINGVLQGRKMSDPRGASVLSRRRMWEAVLEVAEKTHLVGLNKDLRAERRTYEYVKKLPESSAREQMKTEVRSKALVGWARNIGDDQWSL